MFSSYCAPFDINFIKNCVLQAVLSTVLKTVVVPYVNLWLWKGLPLPLPHGFTLQNSETFSTNSRLTIYSDVAFAER